MNEINQATNVIYLEVPNNYSFIINHAYDSYKKNEPLGLFSLIDFNDLNNISVDTRSLADKSRLFWEAYLSSSVLFSLLNSSRINPDACEKALRCKSKITISKSKEALRDLVGKNELITFDMLNTILDFRNNKYVVAITIPNSLSQNIPLQAAINNLLLLAKADGFEQGTRDEDRQSIPNESGIHIILYTPEKDIATYQASSLKTPLLQEGIHFSYGNTNEIYPKEPTK